MRTIIISFIFLCTLLSSNALLAQSRSSAQVSFHKIWVTHNVYKDGKKGMRIYVDFNIRNMKGMRCNAVAYFFNEAGYPLRNAKGSFNTKNGNVATGKYFTPGYNDTRYSRLSMFMPYQELHMYGKNRLKFHVKVLYNNQRQIGAPSSWTSFNLDWRRT